MSKVSPAPWRALPPVILFSLLSAWTADAIKGVPPFVDWLSPESRYIPVEVKILIAVVLLVSLCSNVFWLYRIRKVWRLPPRVLSQREGSESRKVLVMGLSTPPERVKGFDLGGSNSILIHHHATGNMLEIPRLEDAMENMQGHNWQQSLRAINPHARTTLALLVVVPSSGAGGSSQFTSQFQQWIKHYQTIGAWQPFNIEIAPAVDYEAFEALQGAYVGALKYAEKMGFREEDMVIDVTAGQKTNSVAAAMVTLTSEVDFQYVQTASPFSIVTYSVISEGPRDPG
jgi:hypothetical protein